MLGEYYDLFVFGCPWRDWFNLFPFNFQEKQPFERIEVTRQQALEMFSDNKFKAIEYCHKNLYFI